MSGRSGDGERTEHRPGTAVGLRCLGRGSTVEAEQLPGGMSDLRAVMSMQIGDSSTHGAEQALDDSELTGSPLPHRAI